MFEITQFSVAGKKAIVTGGTGSLCKAIGQAYHDLGAEVVLLGYDKNGWEQAKEMATPEAPVHFVFCDLTNTEEIPEKFKECLNLLGGHIDILVNGAGIQHRAPALEFPQDKWRNVLEVNLNALFFFSQLAGREMCAQGYGKIINIASMTAFFGSELIPAYAASKGGVAQLTKALSNEWAKYGVNVNAIAPGYMETPLTADIKTVNPEQYKEHTGRIPMGRWGKPEDLLGICVFLASEASRYVSGAVIPVDGGYLGK